MSRALLTAWLALTLAFVGLRVVPGDAVESQLRAAGGSAEQVQAQRALFGLDKPLIQQYVDTVTGYVQGDFGRSLTSRERVRVVIADRMGPTFALAGTSLLLATFLGWLMGSLAALGAFSSGNSMIGKNRVGTGHRPVRAGLKPMYIRLKRNAHKLPLPVASQPPSPPRRGGAEVVPLLAGGDKEGGQNQELTLIRMRMGSKPAPTKALLRRVLTISAEGFTALSLAVPVYWSATLVIFLAAHQLSFLGLPSGGSRGVASLILPALVLGFAVSGGIARIVAAALRENASRQFIMTARAKGLHPLRVYEHALRASLLPILSIIALQAGFLLSGAVIIEFMFTRRGLGSLLHQAVLDQDYPVVQALVLLAAIFYSLTRTLAGWLGRRADPRQAAL
jgi:peptide/nickel transport system permease protein